MSGYGVPDVAALQEQGQLERDRRLAHATRTGDDEHRHIVACERLLRVAPAHASHPRSVKPPVPSSMNSMRFPNGSAA